MSDAAALLAAQIGALWSDGRTDLIPSMYAPGCIDHMPVPGQAAGHAGLAQAVELFRAGLPDLALRLHGTIACRSQSGAEWGVDWWSLTGTHGGPLFGLPPSGRRVAFDGIDWVRIEAGRVAELWHVEDLYRMETALGLPPGPAPPVPPSPPAAPSELPADLDAGEQAVLAVTRQHAEGVWAAGRFDLASAIYAPDVIDMNPVAGQPPGAAGMIAPLHALRAAAPDLSMAVEAIAVQARHAAVRWTMLGTHVDAPLLDVPAAGHRFVLRGMHVVRVDDAGRIDRLWHATDLAGLRSQLLAP